MHTPIGKTVWAFADLFWPKVDNGQDYVSHEAICVLNLSDQTAHIDLTFYFEDQEPLHLQTVCPARRTNHIRLDRLKGENGALLPRGAGYAAVLESDIPLVAHYTRVDTTQPELALMTTVGYGC